MPNARRSGDRAIRRTPSARRIRAARAFSGLERPAFAKLSGVEVERLNYLENGKGAGPSDEEVQAVQKAAGVPMSFLRHGFDYEEGAATEELDRRLGQLAETVQREIGRLEERLDVLASKVIPLTEPDAAPDLPLDASRPRRTASLPTRSSEPAPPTAREAGPSDVG